MISHIKLVCQKISIIFHSFFSNILHSSTAVRAGLELVMAVLVRSLGQVPKLEEMKPGIAGKNIACLVRNFTCHDQGAREKLLQLCLSWRVNCVQSWKICQVKFVLTNQSYAKGLAGPQQVFSCFQGVQLSWVYFHCVQGVKCLG